MTKRPVGLMWYRMSFERSPSGIAGSMTSRMIASRRSSVPIASSCWVETTTVSTATGRWFSYTTVTCALPSGRSHGSRPDLRHSASRRVSSCASWIGSGMSEAVSSVA
jgi:hypothetical protein